MSFPFEWDPAKAEENLRKHGVSFAEAEIIFVDPLSRDIPDPEHSIGEERFIAIGQSYRKRLLIVVYTEREDRIRIITARKATSRERRDYEEG